LELVPFVQSCVVDDVSEGVLVCACGSSYPIIKTIPRMLKNAYALFPSFVALYGDRAEVGSSAAAQTSGTAAKPSAVTMTQRSFGYQWTTFSEMACDFQENFWNYLHPATPEFFRGRLGLDAGCGFGRHLYHAASCGAEIVGMDLSQAIESSYQNTRQFPNVHLVQGDIYAPPFASGTFDFVYSVGVLHHLPDPERGVRTLVPLVRPDGSMFVWLYSKKRRFLNLGLECLRSVTTRLPYGLVKGLSLVGALIDAGFVLPYRMLKAMPGVGGFFERIAPPRVKLYSLYPFQVLHADWFDRLAAPIRFYYDGPEVAQLLQDAELSDVSVAPTGLYGWRGCGVSRGSPGDIGQEMEQASAPLGGDDR
jgi:SAM-dependent methyltransferase